MPEDIILENGETRSVPTAEELAGFTDAATKAAELQTQFDTLQKTHTELEDLGGEGMKNMRTRVKQQNKLIEQLKEQGKQVDDNGIITDIPEAATKAEMETTATNAAKNVFINNKKDELLATLPEDKRESVKNMMTKLSAGEEMTASNLGDYFDMAKRATNVGQTDLSDEDKFNAYGGGSGPKAETPTGDAPSAARGLELMKGHGIDTTEAEKLIK